MKMFVIYSLIGWLLEICVISYQRKKFTNNHYLLLPFCPMYGLAAITIVNYTYGLDNIFLIFFLSILIALIFEYTTAYLLEHIYDVRWWNYEKKKIQLHGRICLINAIWFGLLGLLVYYIDPYIYDIIKNWYFLNYILILILIDSVISAYYTYKTTFNLGYKDNTIAKYIRLKIKNNRTLS